VVYSRKSNFFCDCGEGGKCICLNSDPNKEAVPKNSSIFGGNLFGMKIDLKKEMPDPPAMPLASFKSLFMNKDESSPKF